jgi:uncharacterized membrane protein YdbT with pleckstrin-like domain
MSERQVVRPSIKLVVAAYGFTAVVLAAAAWGLYGYLAKEPQLWHLAALVLLLIPLRSHIRARIVSLTVEAERLTLETGLLSRTRRTFDLAKVQDVTARQTLGQRLLGTGDLLLETAGESGAMVVEGIDDPRRVADVILERAHEVSRRRAAGA